MFLADESKIYCKSHTITNIDSASKSIDKNYFILKCVEQYGDHGNKW